MNFKVYLTRPEAAEYFSNKGLHITAATLQKLASVGGGPIYRRFGNKAVYTVADLDTWLSEKLRPMRSTSTAA